MIQDTTAFYDNVIVILSYFAYEIILFYRNISLQSPKRFMFGLRIFFHLGNTNRVNALLCALHKYK